MKHQAKQQEEKRAQIRCWNGIDGCGQLLDIVKVHKDTQQIEAKNFHPGVRLCLPCCNKLAYDWKIPFDDVDMVAVAKHNARAGKCGVEPTKDEVWAILRKLGVKAIQKRPEWSPRPTTDIPVGDRA